MRINHINITRFRNLHDFRLELSPGVNLFYGENGHGKTNLLESAALIVNGRTPRASRIHEVVPHDGDFAKWEIELNVEDVHNRVECVIERGNQKRLIVDGQARKKLPGHDKGVWALTFFPEDFKILTGEPFNRRRFLDEIILLTEPAYMRVLKSYKEAYAARNAMLKSRVTDGMSFEPYEEILSNLGIEMTSRRAKATEELQNILERLSQDEFGDEISIALEYKPSLESFVRAENPVEQLKEAYGKSRPRDMAIKRTMLGPHRDDFTSTFSDEDIRKFSSRGETRLSVVALIIAKYHILRQRWNLNPVILLDDIFSELDQTRRRKVLKALPKDCQLMITAVDRDLSKKWLEGMNDIAMFSVLDGKINRDE
ncbi:DNA replication and repair protein RecF [bacterium]|nr:DNA replication and repair protein RecF [bacterium]